MIHELSHYIVSVWLYINTLGLIFSFPTIRIDKYPKITFINPNYNITRFSASVNLKAIKCNYSRFLNSFSVVAPAITVILGLIYLPWYAKIFIISNIDMLWLSESDTNSLINTYKYFYRIYTRNCKNYLKPKQAPLAQLDSAIG